MLQKPMIDKLLWLLEISRRMLATRELGMLAPLITDAFTELTGAQHATLFLRDRETLHLTQRCSRTSEKTDGPSDDILALALAKKVVQNRKTTFPAQESSEAGASTEGRSKALCMPLMHDGEVCGILHATWQTAPEGPFDDDHRRCLQLLADHAVAAIENARMFERATNDPLTGLPNNSYFVLQLTKAMREATPTSAAGVLLLDLDAFKRINNIAGAGMGDRALIDIASTLQEVLRADGLVARYSSDKFAILLPPEADTKVGIRLRDVAERARAAVSAKSYQGIHMTASIGGLAYPGPKVESAPDLIALVDDLLGEARTRGHGQIQIA